MAPITLTWHEVAMASEIGRLRQLAALKAKRVDQHGFTGDGWSEHIEGACGELAVAKALGRYWDGSINTFTGDDLPGLQVRTRSSHHYDLLVRPQDKDMTIWVHVTGRCPNYVVHGWLTSHDAKQPVYLKSYGNRPPAYFVPATALRPLSELSRHAATGS